MDDKTKVNELNGKRVIFNTMPATVGFSVAMRMRVALTDDTSEQSAKIMQDCLYAMLKYCKLVLDDGREIALDNESFINQHFTSQELIELQKSLLHFNFGFLMKGDH